MTATPLSDALDHEVFGGKAATLARLHAAGFSVPDTMVLGADLLDRADGDAPAVLRDAVVAAFDELAHTPLVVRSSAIGEDGLAASFAGMFVSHLDVVDVEGALEAIADIRDSARLARVSAYRGGHGPPRVAVLVQRQVDAQCAGVAFTADPVTGDATTVLVSAVRGLADALVSGRAVPEDWVVERDGIARRQRSGHGEGDVLDAGLARTVAELARRVEDHLGVAVDLEWVHDGERLHIIQARPITVLPTPPAALDGSGWQKDQVHYPEPYTPFGASLMLGPDPVIDDGFAAMTEEFGLLVADMDSRMVGGEVYVRPVPVVGPRNGGRPPPAAVLGIAARLAPPLAARMRAARNAARDGLPAELVSRWESEWRDAWTTRTDTIAKIDVRDLTDERLLGHVDDCVQLAAEGQALHFRLFVPYAVALHRWAIAAEEHLGWDVAKAMSVLPSPASVAGVDQLRTIAAGLSDAARDALAHTADPVAELRQLGEVESSNRLEAWMATHGWRTANYDPGSPALAERPTLIAQLLVDLSRADQPVAPEAFDPDHLPSPAREACLRASAIAPMREDNLLLTDNLPLGFIRRWLVEASRRLVDRGKLDRRDDAAYLTYGEVRTLLSGEVPDDLAVRIARRRGEQAWTRARPGPVAVGKVHPPPDLRRLPRAGRIFNEAIMWMIGLEYPSGDEQTGHGDVLVHGIGAAPGVYRGPVRVVRGEADFGRLRPGEVLVCPITTPAWTVLFATAGALVADTGGVVSHTAIVAREHGLPAVVATRTATRDLRDGDVVEVDGLTGSVRRATDVHRLG